MTTKELTVLSPPGFWVLLAEFKYSSHIPGYFTIYVYINLQTFKLGYQPNLPAWENLQKFQNSLHKLGERKIIEHTIKYGNNSIQLYLALNLIHA